MEEHNDMKRLRVDYSKCTGCHLCEIACSLFNEKICNPAVSRICVVRWEEAFDFPMVCHQCDDAPCVSVCPANARIRNTQNWAIHVDIEKCIGCRMCMYECPFGAISVRKEDEKTTNCTLCNGDPRCVKVCDTEALKYMPLSDEAAGLFEQAKEKMREFRETIE